MISASCTKFYSSQSEIAGIFLKSKENIARQGKYRSDKGEEKRLEDTKECALYCTVSHRFDAKLLVSFEASLCLFLRYSNQFQIRISLGERRCSLGAARRRKALWIKTNDTTKQAKLFFLLSCVVFSSLETVLMDLFVRCFEEHHFELPNANGRHGSVAR